MTNTSEYNKTFLDKYSANLATIIDSGSYILGNSVRKFEEAFSQYISGGHTIGVGSGTSALEIAFSSLDLKPEDEIVIQANAYIACAFGAIRSNARIRIVDCESTGCFSISEFEKAINGSTRAVLVVHLYGDSCDMDRMTDICKKKNITLIEDCAQSLGSRWNDKKLGSFGDISCHSFYPTKNLGAIGDAGAIMCKSPELAERIRKMRNLGSSQKYIHDINGTNSRMDSLQALFLLEKLPFMDDVISKKQEVAKIYNNYGLSNIRNPDPRVYHSYHLYVITTNRRDSVMKYLADMGVETIIHYPVPFYKSGAFSDFNHFAFENAEKLAKTILSIPLHTSLSEESQSYIADSIRSAP